jgi:hypothetical protein
MHPFESNVSDHKNTLSEPINAVHGNDFILRLLADSSRYLELVPKHWDETHLHPLLKQYSNKEKS